LHDELLADLEKKAVDLFVIEDRDSTIKRLGEDALERSGNLQQYNTSNKRLVNQDMQDRTILCWHSRLSTVYWP
jgi:hypothetical protein